jgi:ketosteroid isomerase-like protein
MSQENVELVRAAFEDFLAGKAEFDTEGLLTKLPSERHWDSDIEWEAPEGVLPDMGGVYRGQEAVRGFWREWLAAWELVKFEYELVDAGDRVVALIDQRMHGRSTSIEVPLGKYAQVLTFRDGLIVHWKVYMSQEEALEAVGLSEQDAHADS